MSDQQHVPTQSEVDDLEWEEWDGSSPFLHHCLAGSIAGVAEHTLLYPMDTVKTHMQSYCADCPNNKTNNLSTGTTMTRPTGFTTSSQSPNMGVLRTTFHLLYPSHPNPVRSGSTTLACPSIEPPQNIPPKFLRLFRGIQTMVIGCVPAHALYFSSFEIVKDTSISLSPTHTLSPLGASLAGATATFFHDVIMTPLDTVKQRLQLGHYQGVNHAIYSIYKNEGFGALYRSFPITLLSNVPYGMIMVSTNEGMKHYLRPDGQFDLSTSMLAGSAAGFAASAVTTPLDRIKTRLQTQRLGNAPTNQTLCEKGVSDCALRRTGGGRAQQFEGIKDAVLSVVRAEGLRGLWRGTVPRVLTHTPSVAICWTSYEGVKSWLKVNWEY